MNVEFLTGVKAVVILFLPIGIFFASNSLSITATLPPGEISLYILT